MLRSLVGSEMCIRDSVNVTTATPSTCYLLRVLYCDYDHYYYRYDLLLPRNLKNSMRTILRLRPILLLLFLPPLFTSSTTSKHFCCLLLRVIRPLLILQLLVLPLLLPLYFDIHHYYHYKYFTAINTTLRLLLLFYDFITTTYTPAVPRNLKNSMRTILLYW